MATPTLTRHRVAGVLGDIDVDVRSGGRATPRPAVITVHGFKGFKEWGMWPPFAERLARAGLTAVSINLSGSGIADGGSFTRPDRFGHNTFSAELDDLGRVIDVLVRGEMETASPTGLGLVGHSRGGGLAILQTARDPRIRTLVTWAAISTVDRWPAYVTGPWRAAGVKDFPNSRTGESWPLFTDVLDDIERNAAALDIHRAARRIAVPWLLVHGRDDESVAFAEAERLAEAAGTRARFLPINDTGHTFGAAHPLPPTHPALDLVFDETVAFLSAGLLS